MKAPCSINVLGDGKIPLSALASTLCETTDKTVFITTRKHSLNGINTCKFDHIPNLEYSIMFADEEIHSFSNFENDMKKNSIRVGIVPISNKIFPEIIENGNGGIWFSACRDGLYQTYLPIMEKYITKETHIFAFDNDAKIVEEARKRCGNPHIHIHQCTIHSLCTSLEYDYSLHTLRMSTGKECLLVFPPEGLKIQDIFENMPMKNRADLIFTESKEEYLFYSAWKKISINAMHTLAAVKAYSVGLNNGLSFVDISNKPLSAFVSESEMIDYILNVYSLLYDIHLGMYAKTTYKAKEFYISTTKCFIKSLYNLHDTIGRGLDIYHSSFTSKVTSHFPLLESSKDVTTLEMLDNFKKACNLLNCE